MSSLLKWRAAKQAQDHKLETSGRSPTSMEQWLMACGTLWFMTGLFLDGWAHKHIDGLETFFTPWHAVFYSGYFLTVAILLGIVWRNKKVSGRTFLQSVPIGYKEALIGACIFLIAGLGDLVWHELFGIEADIEALLSPTHLMLATGLMLMTGANLRAWLASPPPIGIPSLWDQAPMLLSLSSLLSLLSFMTQFSHFITVRAGGIRPSSAALAELNQSVAVTGYLLHIAVMMGCVFLIARRARLANGAVTLVFATSILAMGLMKDGLALLPSAIVAGIAADVFLRRMFPLEQHVRAVRAFAFFIPCILFAGYFLTVKYTQGIWWSVHMWTGSIVMAGIVGLLLSYLVVPPTELDA